MCDKFSTQWGSRLTARRRDRHRTGPCRTLPPPPPLTPGSLNTTQTCSLHQVTGTHTGVCTHVLTVTSFSKVWLLLFCRL